MKDDEIDCWYHDGFRHRIEEVLDVSVVGVLKGALVAGLNVGGLGGGRGGGTAKPKVTCLFGTAEPGWSNPVKTAGPGRYRGQPEAEKDELGILLEPLDSLGLVAKNVGRRFQSQPRSQWEERARSWTEETFEL